MVKVSTDNIYLKMLFIFFVYVSDDEDTETDTNAVYIILKEQANA